jgi:hypothetical protein
MQEMRDVNYKLEFGQILKKVEETPQKPGF